MDYDQLNKDYTENLSRQIDDRFRIDGADFGPNFESELIKKEGYYLTYKGVECYLEFYSEGPEKSILAFEMKTKNRSGLVDKIKNSISGTKIDKSKYFRRPEVNCDETAETVDYGVQITLKKTPTRKKQRDEMLGYIWGNLISKMLNAATTKN